ncbi:four-carbon acid sugar kinase family protein [Dinoroseobacter sp. PD6]|uniref:3-oxo-tetronate kinase n=1 Tax=Dinoroseobacter sp. PD6 TaxID=3028384 RepID=UPI00237BCAB4|nr:3-oxo-tetronate kinase [Dinoroseobacter sp. PD6]MDD9718552.1 four-carbon acid sugar kinase family protein [Dinoroseobacter sp. PD6]
MLIGVIADDFTGASDIANTLAKGLHPEGGLRTAQFVSVPDGAAPANVDAGVISLKSRTAPIAEAVADSVSAFRWLQAQGCRQFIFKYCSTFDSTKEGNIGPVAEALADELRADKVVFCPAFPTTGRTVYQGHLFVGDKPLNESGLENHPLTPMTDADIRRWLGHQTNEAVGHVPHAAVAKGASAIRQAMARIDARFVIADAIDDADLITLGEALSDATLITGGSGIALGLPRNFLKSVSSKQQLPGAEACQGAEAILAGSCSGATRGQIDFHAADHPTLAIDVPGVMAGTVTAETLVKFYRAHVGSAPLAYSSGTPDEVKALQLKFGREEVAAKLDALFSETAAMLVDLGFRRIVVAGGETSGAVAQAISQTLSAPAMNVGREIDPGVPVLTLGNDRKVALALKSGNFGAPEFFVKALRLMEGSQ